MLRCCVVSRYVLKKDSGISCLDIVFDPISMRDLSLLPPPPLMKRFYFQKFNMKRWISFSCFIIFYGIICIELYRSTDILSNEEMGKYHHYFVLSANHYQFKNVFLWARQLPCPSRGTDKNYLLPHSNQYPCCHC